MSDEFTTLQNEARPLNLYVGKHRQWRDGPYYVSRLGEPSGGGLLKFVTAERVREYLADYAKPSKPLARASEDADELHTLQNQARPLGFFIGTHKAYDPCSGGPYFVMPRKRSKDERCPTLLKYASAEQVEDFLTHQADTYAA